MSGSSVFLRLFKYRPGDGRVSQEDFFTEALAGVLDASSSLRVAFVQWLIGIDELEAVDVSTQHGLAGGGRVDMWIDARGGGIRHRVAMENKIDAAVSETQLRAYENALRKEEVAGSRTLVCATRHQRADLSCGSPVAFRAVLWREAADWLRRWLRERPSEPVGPLVRELLYLMEEWNMAIHLTADDLATATRYRTSVENEMSQILDEIYNECVIPQGQGNWSFRQPLIYTSRRFSESMQAGAEFGFDFERNDEIWSVPRLGLPSAYFAVWGTEGRVLKKRLETLDWPSAPEGWSDNYLRVKQLDSIVVSGDSLHLHYLEFFKTARAELWKALKF